MLPLLLTSRPVMEQDNEAIASAKNAATVIEVTGTAQVKPTRLYLMVNVFAEGRGRAVVAATHKHSLEVVTHAVTKMGLAPTNPGAATLLLRVDEQSYRSPAVPESQDRADDVFKVDSQFLLSVKDAEQARAAFAAMRETGAAANVVVNYGLDNDEAARLEALKSAVTQASKQVEVLNQAAKPKVFELVYVKQGEFSPPSTVSFSPLRGRNPLVVLPTVETQMSVTLFYGFKSTTAKPTPKAAALVKKPGAPARAVAKK